MTTTAIDKWHSIVRTLVAARSFGCVFHCGHLQLAVDFTEKDLQKYQQFEGEQPCVIERINP